jgi:hypothetical protein
MVLSWIQNPQPLNVALYKDNKIFGYRVKQNGSRPDITHIMRLLQSWHGAARPGFLCYHDYIMKI